MFIKSVKSRKVKTKKKPMKNIIAKIFPTIYRDFHLSAKGRPATDQIIDDELTWLRGLNRRVAHALDERSTGSCENSHGDPSQSGSGSSNIVDLRPRTRRGRDFQ